MSLLGRNLRLSKSVKIKHYFILIALFSIRKFVHVSRTDLSKMRAYFTLRNLELHRFIQKCSLIDFDSLGAGFLNFGGFLYFISLLHFVIVIYVILSILITKINKSHTLRKQFRIYDLINDTLWVNFFTPKNLL